MPAVHERERDRTAENVQTPARDGRRVKRGSGGAGAGGGAAGRPRRATRPRPHASAPRNAQGQRQHDRGRAAPQPTRGRRPCARAGAGCGPARTPASPPLPPAPGPHAPGSPHPRGRRTGRRRSRCARSGAAAGTFQSPSTGMPRVVRQPPAPSGSKPVDDQAVALPRGTWSHVASSAARAGASRAPTLTLPGASAGVTVNAAPTGGGRGLVEPVGEHERRARRSSPRRRAGRRPRRGSSPRQRPCRPARRAARPAVPATAASSQALDQQRSLPRQPERELRPTPLGRAAGGPREQAADRAEREQVPSATEHQRGGLDQRAPRRGRAAELGVDLPQHRADEQRHPARARSGGRRRRRRAPRRVPIHTRAATSATPAASAISAGWSTARNCGDAGRIEPGTSTGRSGARPSARPGAASRSARTRRAAGRPTRADRARTPSCSSTAWPISVIPAPPNNIRWVGPQSVTSWPNTRCQTSSSGKPASANAPQRPSAGRRPARAARRRCRPRGGAGGSRGIAIASTPARKTPNRPTRLR